MTYNSILTWFGNSCREGECPTLNILGSLGLTHSQLYSTWNPVVLKCLITTEKGVLGLIPTIFADLALILIMLVGLLRLRRHGSGMFGLTPILWRQVRWRFCLAVILSIDLNVPCFSRESFGYHLL